MLESLGAQVLRNTVDEVRNRARPDSCTSSSDRLGSDGCRPSKDGVRGRGVEMAKNAYMVVYFVVMVAAIVGVDFLFFRDRFTARLIANIAIVAVFAAVYFLLLRSL